MIAALLALGDRSTRRTLLGYLALSVGSSVLVAVMFTLLFPLVGALFSGRPVDALPVALWMVALMVVASGLDWVGTVIGQRSGAQYILRIHEVIADRAAKLPLGWFDEDRSGSISQLVTKGAVFAANAPELILRPMLHGLLVPSIAAVVVAGIDWRLGCCFVVGVLAVTLAYRWSNAHSRANGELVEQQNAESGSRVLEFALAQPAIRAAGPGSLAERAVRAAVTGQLRATQRAEITKSRAHLVMNGTTFGAMLLVFVVAASLILAQAVSVPVFLAALVLAVALGGFALQALPFGAGLELAMATLHEVQAMLDAPLLAEPATPAEPVDASIEFVGVDFAYVPGSSVVSGASFRVEPGTTTAIVGPSGSGKSTIARLIARFHEVDGGSIRIGGYDLRELGTAAVMARLSMVFQDVYLFEDTLRENIRLGRPGASDGEVLDAAARAGVTEIVERLPGGFDTVVGESGGTLSGGERQRVSIARALLKDAPIVLLDEATAALDIESEALIQRGLAELSGTKTLVVIAHRLQTIRQADQIVVLDGSGGIEAVGGHAALLVSSPTYAGFWRERAAGQGWRIDAQR